MCIRDRGEDAFFLSNGHISPVFYSTLARFGFFPVQELSTFRKLNTRLQGHPTTHEHLEGVRTVSYTHLDVYKRQYFSRTKIFLYR